MNINIFYIICGMALSFIVILIPSICVLSYKKSDHTTKCAISFLICFLIFAISAGSLSTLHKYENPFTNETVLKFKESPKTTVNAADCSIDIYAKNENYNDVILSLAIYKNNSCLFFKDFHTYKIKKGNTAKIYITLEILKEINTIAFISIDAFFDFLLSENSDYNIIFDINNWK